jgi:hypothetical protein
MKFFKFVGYLHSFLKKALLSIPYGLKSHNRPAKHFGAK